VTEFIDIEEQAPTPEHQALFSELLGIVKKHEHLDKAILLALTSQVVGACVACLPKDCDPFAVETLIWQNIKNGNSAAYTSHMLNQAGIKTG
jgi:hypothetical protein